MGNGDSCEIVYVEDICADVEYVIYEKYLEPYGLSENDSLIRIVADEFLLGVIDTAQPEETLYFARYEVMHRILADKYPNMEESLLDHTIETLYAEIF